MSRLDFGNYSPVMATGILSVAAAGAGLAPIAWPLLALAVAILVGVAGHDAWLLLRQRRRVARELQHPDRAIDLFTSVAALSVLGSRIGAPPPRLALSVLAAACWLAAWAALAFALRRSQASVRGSWLLLVVAAQSLAILLMPLTGLAVLFWLLGLLLYLPVASLIVRGLYRRQTEPAADFWILMGALAISTLAATAVLPPARAVAAGLGLWILASAWIPYLLLATRWRSWLRYDHRWWSLVFPLGMYSAASQALLPLAGGSLHFLRAIADLALGAGLIAWLLTVSSWLASRRRSHEGAAPAAAGRS